MHCLETHVIVLCVVGEGGLPRPMTMMVTVVVMTSTKMVTAWPACWEKSGTGAKLSAADTGTEQFGPIEEKRSGLGVNKDRHVLDLNC